MPRLGVIGSLLPFTAEVEKGVTLWKNPESPLT
jgi:hypothetical protein